MKSRVCSLLLPLVLLASVWLSAQDAEKRQGEQLSKLEKVQAALPQHVKQQASGKRLLVFSRTCGYRHQSIELGKTALRLLGEETGAYEAVLSDELSNFEAENIRRFDAICFLNTTLEVFRPSSEEWSQLSVEQQRECELREQRLQKNLLDFVRSGGGFVGIHAAADTFHQWPEYGEMLGAYFDDHPWNAGTTVAIAVDASAKRNPMVAHFGDEKLVIKEEIYQFKDPYESARLEMLLRLDTEKTNMQVSGINRKDGDFGVSWTKSYGNGRVFYCSLGHNEHIYWNPKVLEFYLKGIQWALD